MSDLTDKNAKLNDGKIQIGFCWTDSKITLPQRKAAEAEVIEALEKLNAAFGGREFEVVDINVSARRDARVVTIQTEGAIDSETLIRLIEESRLK